MTLIILSGAYITLSLLIGALLKETVFPFAVPVAESKAASAEKPGAVKVTVPSFSLHDPPIAFMKSSSGI